MERVNIKVNKFKITENVELYTFIKVLKYKDSLFNFLLLCFL